MEVPPQVPVFYDTLKQWWEKELTEAALDVDSHPVVLPDYSNDLLPEVTTATCKIEDTQDDEYKNVEQMIAEVGRESAMPMKVVPDTTPTPEAIVSVEDTELS